MTLGSDWLNHSTQRSGWPLGPLDLISSTGSTLADWQRLLHAQTISRQAAMEREEVQIVPNKDSWIAIIAQTSPVLGI